MSSGAQMVKNASWLILATTLNKLLAFVTFSIVARHTGPAITGVFFYAVSVTSVAVVFADLGLTPVVIRAIASGREDASQLLGAALRLKMLFAPCAIALALVYGFFQADSLTIFLTIGVACLVMTADTFHLILYGTLRGKQNLKPEAVGMLVGQILTAIVSIAVALLGFGPIGLACGLLAGSTWNVLWAIRMSRRLGVQMLAPAASMYTRLLVEALPFALAGIAVKLYSYTDSILIQAYHGDVAVGLYAVAYKMTYALQFLPLTFTAALYPALAAAWSQKRTEDLSRIFTGSFRFMALLSFPLSAGLSALAGAIIPLVYGSKYIDAVAAFQMLPWVLLPIFLDFPVGALLNATHRAHLKTTAMVCTMVINIALNAVLVPRLGIVGAAWSGVASFWILLLIGLLFIRRDVGGWQATTSILFRGGIAAACAWGVWSLSENRFGFPIAAILGALACLILAALFGLVQRSDLERIQKLRASKGMIEG